MKILLHVLKSVIHDLCKIYLDFVSGEDGSTIEGAIKLVKLAYCFEQFEWFDAMIEPVMTYLRVCKILVRLGKQDSLLFLYIYNCTQNGKSKYRFHESLGQLLKITKYRFKFL